MLKRQVLLSLAALALVAGCAAERPNRRLILQYEKGIEIRDLNSLLQQAPPGPVAVIELGRTAWVSHYLAVVREGETPHYHRFHDLTVFVLRGEGVLDVEGKRFMMRSGDVAQVHRGVRHYFRNTGTDVAAAVVTFSPPFDGRDTVTAEEPAAEQPPEPGKGGSKPSGGHSSGGEPEAHGAREGSARSIGGTGGARIATNGSRG